MRTNGKPPSNCLVAIAVWHAHSYRVIQLSSSPAPVFSHSPPPSDIMGQSKVTHIYPIKRGFEKTHIELQLMLQWGPESERCYRPKRLGFQGPANKRQSSPQREREKEGMGVMMGRWRVHTVKQKRQRGLKRLFQSIVRVAYNFIIYNTHYYFTHNTV